MTNSHNNPNNDLSDLSSKDHDIFLLQALVTNEEVLQQSSPDVEPLGYAGLLGNRGLLLHDLANLPGEDRRARLLQALVAYDQALLFFNSNVAPLDYAGTQNNRGIVLSALANLPGEEQHARLEQALTAYDEALCFRRPDSVPLDYAVAQASRGNVLSALADLPNEDRHARLVESLAAYDEALRFYNPDTTPFEYAAAQNNRGNLLHDLADLPGEDRLARLAQALYCAWSALSRFQQIAQESYAQIAANALGKISARAGEFFPTLWNDLNIGEPPQWLIEYLQWQRVPQSIRNAVSLYDTSRKRADVEDRLEGWQRVIAIGKQLIQYPHVDQPPLAIRELRVGVANCWYNLGFAFYKQKRLPEARAAFGEALQLRPDFASWYCDHALTNVRLGDFDAAEVDLAQAAELESDHPRLERLRGELNEARHKHDSEPEAIVHIGT